MQKLIDFINNRPALKASILEAEAGIPKRGLWNALKGHQGLSTKHAWRLCIVLCEYGLVLDGWLFRYDEDLNNFFVEREIEDRDPEVKEIPTDHGTYFEYFVPMYRDVIDSPVELISFFKLDE